MKKRAQLNIKINLTIRQQILLHEECRILLLDICMYLHVYMYATYFVLAKCDYTSSTISSSIMQLMYLYPPHLSSNTPLADLDLGNDGLRNTSALSTETLARGPAHLLKKQTSNVGIVNGRSLMTHNLTFSVMNTDS